VERSHSKRRPSFLQVLYGNPGRHRYGIIPHNLIAKEVKVNIKVTLRGINSEFKPSAQLVDPLLRKLADAIPSLEGDPRIVLETAREFEWNSYLRRFVPTKPVEVVVEFDSDSQGRRTPLNNPEADSTEISRKVIAMLSSDFKAWNTQLVGKVIIKLSGQFYSFEISL